MLNKIKRWYKNFTMSPVERYLSNSVSIADLERRQKELHTWKDKGLWL